MRNSIIACVILFVSCAHQDTDGVHKVEVAEFAELIKNIDDKILIDVRTADEFSQGHIENAVNINYNSNSFEKTINGLDTSKTIFVYCLKGGRSASAANYMQHHGFRKVYDLNGGIRSWTEAALPTVK